ncbi:MAG: L,D-transpeptidase [Actinobacteria bacterium]|nr:L,D-transpeptidase [Actinomycetota bacterium]MCL5883372.1 L,D-transpeptidase [Actinomycetota bacterium]
MSRTTSVKPTRTATSATKRKAIIVFASAILVLLFLGYLSMASLFPAGVSVNPGDGSQDVAIDNQIKISTSWMRGSVKTVTVKEITLDPLGAPAGEKMIDGTLNGDTFVRSDGETLLHPDSRYEITVQAQLTDLTLTGPQHQDVTKHATFQTITTPAPVFAKDKQTVPTGEPIVVEFNTPIKSFTYEISPELKSTSQLDENNPTRAMITFDGYEQGKEYTMTITGATAENGAGLVHPYSQKIATTAPLKIFFTPGDGESGVSLTEHPTLQFSEDIKNPEVADEVLSFDPAVLGGWDWVAPDKIEFKPLNDWTQGQSVTIKLKGGTEGFRSVSGSYVREDVQSTFTAKPSKLIDVNLTEQRVYMYDNDQLVKTLICSSGSQATPSLTGRYAVYAKADKVDMRGEGYDAPNVPWVLMFNGDYTIHGNYWSTQFGVPTSHGCVGLPLDQAEYLYNWTPIGTIVSIHY